MVAGLGPGTISYAADPAWYHIAQPFRRGLLSLLTR